MYHQRNQKKENKIGPIIPAPNRAGNLAISTPLGASFPDWYAGLPLDETVITIAILSRTLVRKSNQGRERNKQSLF